MLWRYKCESLLNQFTLSHIKFQRFFIKACLNTPFCKITQLLRNDTFFAGWQKILFWIISLASKHAKACHAGLDPGDYGTPQPGRRLRRVTNGLWKTTFWGLWVKAINMRISGPAEVPIGAIFKYYLAEKSQYSNSSVFPSRLSFPYLDSISRAKLPVNRE